MHKASFAIFAFPMLLLASMAQAQTAGTVTLTANKTSSSSAFAPVLTWSTTPVASSCTASGGWTGTKFASGTETLASISSSKTYTLTCTWGNGSATVRWTKPTKNSDGSSLTDLAGYKVIYGKSATTLSQSKSITDVNATSTVISALQTGAWYFAVRAVNSKQAESDNSNVVQKTITGASAAKSLAITISGSTTPPPSTPGLKTVETRVYDISNGGVGRQIGTIALGKACSSAVKVDRVFYGVSLSDVKQTTKPRSSSVVAKCTTS
jgi:hypothetical protein